MAETGIEDLIRGGGDSSGGGCGMNALVILAVLIVVFTGLALIGSYCAPPQENSNANANVQQK